VTRRLAFIGVALLSSVLAACSSSAGAGMPRSSPPSRQAWCQWVRQGTPARWVALPPDPVPANGRTRVEMRTSQGTLSLTLDRTSAPCTVASFLSLAEQHYFNVSPCHRLTTTGIFVLQCGDPSGTGTGGPGYTIPDEVGGHARYPAGTVAMANAGTPHSGGSQFFIVYRDTALPPQYTVFGRVDAGLDVVRKIAAAGTQSGTGDGKPRLTVWITSMTAAG
jgi:peptidyl-prolyl cis-trans isomerase B (cyclophilin B)